MVRPLELELGTYARERGRLEDGHRGKFVLIRGAEITGIFDDFYTASEHAARRFEREAYLVHCIGTEPMGIPSALLDGLAAVYAQPRRGQQQPGAPSPDRPDEAIQTGRCRRRLGAAPPAAP